MIFVDAGAFYARQDIRDQHHVESIKVWNDLEKGVSRMFTSTLVIVEAITLLARRVSYSFAAEHARLLYASDRLVILRPDAEDERAAISVFEKFADSRISFTDSVSCILMRRHKIKRVFGFDRHFTRMGFDLF